MIGLLEKISVLESSFDEEDSYYFFLDLKSKYQHSYSSKYLPLEDTSSLIEAFLMLHAYIDMSHMGYPRFWSQNPLFVFRYAMDSTNGWQRLSILNPGKYYLVQGASWTNGFYYLVSHNDFLIEANLFIDNETKTLYNYQ